MVFVEPQSNAFTVELWRAGLTTLLFSEVAGLNGQYIYMKSGTILSAKAIPDSLMSEWLRWVAKNG